MFSTNEEAIKWMMANRVGQWEGMNFALVPKPLVRERTLSRHLGKILKSLKPSTLTYACMFSAQTFRERLLNEEEARVQESKVSQWKAILEPEDSPGVALVGDGFRRKCIEQGVPLINILLLTRDNGAFFSHVVKAGGEVKDADWVAELFEEEADALMKRVFPKSKDDSDLLDQLKLDKIMGVILDNPRTNRNALTMLEDK